MVYGDTELNNPGGVHNWRMHIPCVCAERTVFLNTKTKQQQQQRQNAASDLI